MLRSRNLIFFLSMIAGLAFPQASPWTEPLTLPVLALIMTLATAGIPETFFKSIRPLLAPSAAGIVLCYLIAGGATLAMSAWLIDRKEIWIGFVLVALVPPAVAVIPFTTLLGGNLSFTMAGTVAAYLAALVIMPFASLALFGAEFWGGPRLVIAIILLIALPLVLSRILVRTGVYRRIASWQGPITNWGFFIVLYTLVGLNREMIFSEPRELIPVAAVLFVTTFLLGFLIERLGRRFHVSEKDIVSVVLLGTMKNQGIAGGLAITLFTREAALPSAVSAIFLILFFIWLDIRKGEKSRPEKISK